MKLQIAAALAIVALADTVASAHPGHGATEATSWSHYLAEPIHVTPWAAALLAAAASVLAWRWLRTRLVP